MNKSNRRALQAALPHTLPVLAGFSFLGISFGFMMRAAGWPVWFPVLMSLVVYAGSMQFVTANLLAAAFNPVQAFFMTLMVNARHLFYGISMLEKYRNMGPLRHYLIFGMSDETFSVNCSAPIPEDVDKKRFYLFVTLLNQSYWVLGTAVGALLGTFLRFNTEGLDFVMTAMFVVIFLEQLQKKQHASTALMGVFLSATCLVLFGAEHFVIPAMLAILCVLSLLRKPLERGGAAG